MITAEQAKEKTKERIRVLAEEFIINYVGMLIQTAIDKGKFFTKVSLEGTDIAEVDLAVLGEEVVKLLKERGYEAEHVYDGPHGHDNHITIKWED